MRRELPSPDEILEQLADKTALQIDRLRPVAFDAALDELTRYHRFLLHVHATRALDGKPFNYAVVPGEALQSPHNEWINQYRRLFERAANHIGDAPDFIEKLAHVPLRLLPRRDDPEMPSEVLQAIIDLGVILIHQIEAWVTKRTVADTAPNSAAGPRTYLAGSDAKSYTSLLPNIVGAWESLLQAATAIYDWRGDSDATAESRWDSLRASWPFLWRHLCNTAYMLAVSVWNEDEAGAASYRDALVRWPQTLGHNFADFAHFPNRRLLFPEILSLDLGAARERVSPILPEYAPIPSPEELFNSLLHGVHDDVLLLSAALLLLWSMEQKQVSDIGARTASTLLRRQLEDTEHEHRQPAQDKSFASAILDVIRIEIAGDQYPRGTYGADLDYLVARLDNMTERRVVPGRVFAPSTANGRYDLQAAILAILLDRASNISDEILLRSIREISKDDPQLPRGDRSLRDILHSLDRFLKMLDAPSPILSRGLNFLAPDADFSASSDRVKSTITSVVQTVEEQRKIRLRQKPIDIRAIDSLRDAAETAMLNPPDRVPYFKGFLIERTTNRLGQTFRVRLDGLNKAQFVNPPMASESSGFTEYYAKLVAQKATNRILRLFARRQRELFALPHQVEQQSFWEQVKPIARDVGAEPALIVSRRAQSRLRDFVRLHDSSDVPFRIERKPSDQRDNGYVATIEGVDVYGGDLQAGKAWLFSPYLLRSVRYAPVGETGHVLGVTFEPGDDFVGPLIAEFDQEAVWSEWPVYEIDCEDSET